MTCELKTGEGHAFVLSSEGVLDNRFDRVMNYGEVDCAD